MDVVLSVNSIGMTSCQHSKQNHPAQAKKPLLFWVDPKKPPRLTNKNKPPEVALLGVNYVHQHGNSFHRYLSWFSYMFIIIFSYSILFSFSFSSSLLLVITSFSPS
jgi:hypothetical protein